MTNQDRHRTREAVVEELRTHPPVLQTYQRVIREWPGALDGSELVLVLYFLDRTMGWYQKPSITIGVEQILGGDVRWAGLPVSRATLFRKLKTLETKGVIRRTGTKGSRNTYAVDWGWSPPQFEPEADRSSGEIKVRRRRSQPDMEAVSNRDPIQRTLISKEYQSKQQCSGLASPRPAVDTDFGRGGSGSAPPRPVVTPSTTRSTSQSGTLGGSVVAQQVRAAEHLWQSAIQSGFPAALVVAWSVKERAMVRGKAMNWIHGRQIGFPQFVEWSAINWKAVIARQFKWMTRTKKPVSPEIGFLMHFLSGFVDCWCEGSITRWNNAKERTEFERMTARGVPDLEAAAEIGCRRAVVGLRDEMDNREVENKRRLRCAQIAEAQTAKMIATAEPSPALRRRREPVLKPFAPVVEVNWANIPLLDPNWEPPLD